MGILDDYKKKWAKKQMEKSDHPYSFWIEVADMLIQNRKLRKLDLFTPLGNWREDWDVYGFLVSIDNAGIEIEKIQGMEKAFIIYEVCVAENFPGTYPYDRLRIWYTKNKKFKDAIRVCQTFIDVPDKSHHQKSKEHFQRHLNKLSLKLDK